MKNVKKKQSKSSPSETENQEINPESSEIAENPESSEEPT
jgi:hypothetical protein